MIQVNIAELKNRLSDYLNKVQAGHEVEICKRNQPIAVITSRDMRQPNKTRPGCGAKTVKIRGDLTAPVFDSDWDMLGADERPA